MALPTHRSVSNIRPSVTSGHAPSATPSSPHTPTRGISSNFGSPSALRAEEDCVVVEIGNRYLRAGFARDALPKAVIGFGPEEQRRPGDHRRWALGYDTEWRTRVPAGKKWGETHELWDLDLREVDLGLVGDKIERSMREAFSKYLLIDSRPRRMAIVLPPALPLPLLSTILDSLFNNFQPPTISLMSAPVLATVAAGLRAALVVDIGWTETIVTAIYEYREVLCRRTVRASKRLSLEMLKVLENAVSPLPASDDRSGRKPHDSPSSNIISFEEVEDVVTRLSWCKPSKAVKRTTAPTGLPSVREEEEEIEGPMKDLSISEQESDIVSIPLTSTAPPMTLQLPFSTLAMPCEAAFFATGFSRYDLDDEESPLHEIVYSTLLHTPVEVRSVCMSRIVFTGGASVIPGLKARIIDDVQGLIETRGWDIVRGAAVARLRTNPKLHNSRSRKANDGPSEVAREPVFDVQNDRISNLPVALEDQEPDTIGDQIRREGRKAAHPSVQGTLRAVESMGSWTGASLLTHLKVPAVALVEREQWLQHGAAGASKQGEAVVLKQRQSMGPAGLRTGNIEQTTWTLGPWG